MAIRADVPPQVLRDTIQPFPTFSEIYVAPLKALHGQITAARWLTRLCCVLNFQDGPTIVQDVEHAATGRCRARAGRTRCWRG